jgi:tellurite resistance protein TerC
VGTVVGLLVLDLGVLHRDDQEPTFRQSLAWTLFWAALAAALGGLIWRGAGGEAAARYLTGYLVEWSLSVDNLLVFAVIFAHFQLGRAEQYRVLFWGILGAVAMRLVFVLAGAELLAHWDWVLPLFGLLIVYLGIQLARPRKKKVDPEQNFVFRLGRRLLPLANEEHGARLFARDEGRWKPTRLFLVLLVVESVDVVFAVDSVPAVFGVTRDPFIVFSSNVMALAGLRAMYFLVSGLLDRFGHLHWALAAVLVFIGALMVGDYCSERFGWFGGGHELVPYWAKLVVIATLLAGGIGVSMLFAKPPAKAPAE